MRVTRSRSVLPVFKISVLLKTRGAWVFIITHKINILIAPLVADLFLFCYERDFMTSLSDVKQAEIIEAFKSTSRYLDDLLNIDNPYFEGMVNRIYPPELQLN